MCFHEPYDSNLHYQQPKWQRVRRNVPIMGLLTHGDIPPSNLKPGGELVPSYETDSGGTRFPQELRFSLGLSLVPVLGQDCKGVIGSGDSKCY